MTYDWLGLQGKVAAVTGAGSGIGQAVALEFAAAGATVVLLGRTESALAETATQIAAAGGSSVSVAMDVTDQSSVQAAAKQAGHVDILVNNAGISKPGPLDSVALADWQAVLDVNLNGYLLTSQAFGAGMLERGYGALVHVSSISGRNPQGQSGSYSVGKAGVLMLSRQLALEWSGRGVRSNSISPGMVRTPMTEAYYQVGDVAERRDKAVPGGRVARGSDIAQVALFLASDRSAYVTGADIVTDGGFETTLMSTIPRPGYDKKA
jgi:NAD(P)-dependent dehydrogenase (short-subunit alcohol dehydrogenase family)